MIAGKRRRVTSGISDDRGIEKERAGSRLFLFQTPLVARSLFNRPPLTEGLKQANTLEKQIEYPCRIEYNAYVLLLRNSMCYQRSARHSSVRYRIGKETFDKLSLRTFH